MSSTEERITLLESEFITMQNDMEHLFYSLIAARCARKTLEEIVEYAVRDYFKVGMIDFHGKVFVKPGQPINAPEPDRAIIDSRKWFVAIMRTLLYKTSFPLRQNYPFYNTGTEKRFRPTYEAAWEPKTKKDLANRQILLGISSTVKLTAKEEGVLDERLKNFPDEED